LRINASGLLLSTGVDGQGIIQFEYPSMLATVVYSKIFDSPLPTAIHGEEATIIIDHINFITSVTLINRKNKTTENLSLQPLHNEYYYEIAEFMNIIQSSRTESMINSHQHSLWTMEIMDEVRNQVKNR
jgi:predicted dehydrogenase